MGDSHFLWLDYRQQPIDAALYDSVACLYQSCRITHPTNITDPVRELGPQFLCFEFDTPGNTDLSTLQQTRCDHPTLPILIIAEQHTDAMALWAFRSGAWDYLVKPFSLKYLHATIATLSQLPVQRTPHAPNFSAPAIKRGKRTAAALDFIAAHYQQIVHLPEVAKICRLSESEFSRAFKSEQGNTFCEHVLKYRIRKACELLSDSSLQIKSVAFEVGFNDPSYFSRIFHRYTHVTPSEYQRGHNELGHNELSHIDLSHIEHPTSPERLSF